MKLQQAINTLEQDGWIYKGKYREELGGDLMIYTFLTPTNCRREFTLTALRAKADQVGWVLWSKRVQAELAFGIQDELFDTADYAA